MVKSIIEVLVETRIDLKITQKAIAKDLGVSVQSLSQMEKGLVCPKFDTVEKYADLMGYTLELRVKREINQPKI